MNNFEEVRINDNLIIYGTIGGATFKTTIAGMNSGHEQRNSVWTYPRWEAELGDRNVSEQEAKQLRDFFNAMGGQAVGFRCKDWLDFQDDGKGILGVTGLGDNVTDSFQMYKQYQSGTITRLRQIKKPVSGSIKIWRNTTDVTSSCSINMTTGVVTYNPTAKTTNITVGSTTTFTNASTPHGLTTGTNVYFTVAAGADASLILNKAFSVTVVNANTFTIALNTTGKVITGTIQYKVKFQSTDTIKWTGDFDIPVRFATDKFEAQFIAGAATGQYDTSGGAILNNKVFYMKTLPVIEVRL